MKPIPPRSSNLLFEYLLLPPRSATPGISCRLPLETLTHMFDHPLLYAHMIRSNNVVSASRCSAIHFRGSSIRQVNYYTLLGGFQLPWPPSWCYYGAAPFMVSYERAPKHLIQQLSSSPVADSAYQKGPTWKRQLPQWFAEVTMQLTHFKFENWSIARRLPKPLIIRFTS